MNYDVAIIGAGIAGATLAAELAPHARVLLLEMEELPGYHATGRSAAFWSETYGGPDIQPLTTASGPTLRDGGWLEPLGAVQIGRAEDAPLRDAFLQRFAESGIALESVDPRELVPGLREEWCIGVREPTCAYIDVAALHADALARAKRASATLVVRADLGAGEAGLGGWRLRAGNAEYQATLVVNAAGAWADTVAERCGVAPIGIVPYRRTLVQLLTDPGPAAGMPHLASLGADFYIKPEAGGRVWVSPHDETLDVASDVQPEELDVAIAIDRFEHALNWRVAKVERRWAGLRSFASDRLPVVGADPAQPSFFWLAGQGGFGIQTAPAIARMAARLIVGDAVGTIGEDALVDPGRYLPDRLR